jgi:chaperone modulatory protein CbpM
MTSGETMTVPGVLARVRGVDAATLELWIAQEWVRPLRAEGQPVFEEIDVARVRLIVELRDELDLGEPAIPVVLSLLDQLHGAHGRLQRLISALEAAGDRPAREVMVGILR